MFDSTQHSCDGQEEETVLGPKNNMCEGPSQEESVELKKEMVKVPWLQVQEKTV